MTSSSAIDPARIAETAQTALERFHLPGLSIGVVSGDDLVYAEGFGLADIESGREQDPALRQRIGSITKTMVCLCVLALVDEGRLSLDDRVPDLLPDLAFNGPSESLALWHLLTHTGGIGEAPNADDIANPLRVLWADSTDTPPLAEKYPGGITIDVPPGTKWHYANHGWMLVGEIVARAEGAPIEDVLQCRIFEPLGMSDSDNLDLPNDRLSTGYVHAPDHEALDQMELLGMDTRRGDPVDGHNIPGDWVYINGRAAGAVQSTIPDMARYASALLRRGGGIVDGTTFDRAISPQWCPDERLLNIGFSFFRARRFGEFTFGHGGGVDGGWNTNLTVVPGRDMALMVHINAALNSSGEVFSRILHAALGAGPVTRPDSRLDPAVLEAAPGVYTHPPGMLTNSRPVRSHGRLQISVEAGELVIHSRRGAMRNGVRLLPADPSDPFFLALDTDALERPCIALQRDGSGAVTGLRLDRLALMERNESLEPWT